MREHPTITDFYANEKGEVFHFYKGELHKIEGYVNCNGYVLFREHNRHKILAHRFVYECFYGIIPEGMQIDHINTKRADNRIENLRLVTCSDNHANPLSKERHKKAVRNSKGRRVAKIDKASGEIIGDYVSITEAAENNKETYKRIWLELHNELKNNTNDYYFTYTLT